VNSIRNASAGLRFFPLAMTGGREHVCGCGDRGMSQQIPTQACPLPTTRSQWWFSYPFSLREGRNPTKLWLLKAQPILQTRPLQSGSPSPLLLNLLIISSTSLSHQDKLNRSRVCQGGVADMGQPTAFGTKSVRLSSNSSRPSHGNQPSHL
jgi:hypothetical protein